MFKLRTRSKLSVLLRGMEMTPIQMEVRVPTGDWSPFFGKYMNQRWGVFDTESCWVLGGCINELEDQLEWLWKNGYFSQEAKDFFTTNGYIDSDGDFSLSERFIEILGGNFLNGGTAEEAWQLVYKYGCIPRSMLTYSLDDVARFNGNIDMVAADYFNTQYVTQEMLDLGKKFRTYVNTAYQHIGSMWITPDLEVLKESLKMAPIAIGVPIPADVSKWNAPYVQYDGGRNAQHEVELYSINDKGEYLIFDQYEPHLKTLSADYFLPIVTQGIAYAIAPAAVNPIAQDPWWKSFWTAVLNCFNGIASRVQIGHA